MIFWLNKHFRVENQLDNKMVIFSPKINNQDNPENASSSKSIMKNGLKKDKFRFGNKSEKLSLFYLLSKNGLNMLIYKNSVLRKRDNPLLDVWRAAKKHVDFLFTYFIWRKQVNVATFDAFVYQLQPARWPRIILAWEKFFSFTWIPEIQLFCQKKQIRKWFFKIHLWQNKNYVFRDVEKLQL